MTDIQEAQQVPEPAPAEPAPTSDGLVVPKADDLDLQQAEKELEAEEQTAEAEPAAAEPAKKQPETPAEPEPQEQQKQTEQTVTIPKQRLDQANRRMRDEREKRIAAEAKAAAYAEMAQRGGAAQAEPEPTGPTVEQLEARQDEIEEKYDAGEIDGPTRRQQMRDLDRQLFELRYQERRAVEQQNQPDPTPAQPDAWMQAQNVRIANQYPVLQAMFDHYGGEDTQRRLDNLVGSAETMLEQNGVPRSDSPVYKLQLRQTVAHLATHHYANALGVQPVGQPAESRPEPAPQPQTTGEVKVTKPGVTPEQRREKQVLAQQTPPDPSVAGGSESDAKDGGVWSEDRIDNMSTDELDRFIEEHGDEADHFLRS